MITGNKKPFAMALSFAGVLCFAPLVSSDYDDRRASRTSDQPDELRMSTRDQRSFERYLKSNWQIAQQLYQDPELIRDREFVRDHESLDDWLDETWS